MTILARSSPPWADARIAPEASSCGPGRPLSLASLSMRDEEIVVRSRRGELPHDIARALDHDLLDVMRALNRAIVLGLRIRLHPAAGISGDRRST